MFDQMTTQALQVVARASTSARVLGHRRLGTEHLVSGLVELSCCSSTLTGPMIESGIEREEIHAALRSVDREKAADVDGVLPLTLRAVAVLRATPQIAYAHGHPMVTADHVLAAVVADRACGGAQLLAGLGVDLDGLAGRLAPRVAAVEAPVSDRSAGG